MDRNETYKKIKKKIRNICQHKKIIKNDNIELCLYVIKII